MRKLLTLLAVAGMIFTGGFRAAAQNEALLADLYDPGKLKPIDSKLKVKAGEMAPDFELPTVAGKMVRLSDYRGRKNVVLSFVPAAFTPVCSTQWPGYNAVQAMFDENDAVLLGITVDNIPTLYAWTRQMGGVWFEVLSDFWPHGAVANSFGLLRNDGVSERALIHIDKQGVIKSILVMDINKAPGLETCKIGMEQLEQ